MDSFGSGLLNSSRTTLKGVACHYLVPPNLGGTAWSDRNGQRREHGGTYEVGPQLGDWDNDDKSVR